MSAKNAAAFRNILLRSAFMILPLEAVLESGESCTRPPSSIDFTCAYLELDYRRAKSQYVPKGRSIQIAVDGGTPMPYRLFDGTGNDGGWVLNVGTGVTAIDSTIRDNATLVALSTSIDAAYASSQSEVCSSSCIQIIQIQGTHLPTLKFLLCHDHMGQVNALKWLTDILVPADSCGFLAVATSNSRAFIVKVPKIDTSSTAPTRAAYIQRRLDLSIPGVNYELEDDNSVGQCTTICWSGAHNYIATGYSSGYVCLWRIGLQAKLLKLDMPLNSPVTRMDFMPGAKSIVAISYLNARELRMHDFLAERSNLNRFDIFAAAIHSSQHSSEFVIGADECDGKNSNSNVKHSILIQNYMTLSSVYSNAIPGHLMAMSYDRTKPEIVVGTTAGDLHSFPINQRKKTGSYNINFGQKHRQIAALRFSTYTQEDECNPTDLQSSLNKMCEQGYLRLLTRRFNSVKSDCIRINDGRKFLVNSITGIITVPEDKGNVTVFGCVAGFLCGVKM